MEKILATITKFLLLSLMRVRRIVALGALNLHKYLYAKMGLGICLSKEPFH